MSEIVTEFSQSKVDGKWRQWAKIPAEMQPEWYESSEWVCIGVYDFLGELVEE